MICVSIAEPTYAKIRNALRGVDFAEIRLDSAELTLAQIRRLFSQPGKLIATCRPGRKTEGQRKREILTAVASGADYVDIELDAPPRYRRDIVHAAGQNTCKVIISHHDYERTPAVSELKAIFLRCFRHGADIAKIACKVRSQADCARLLALYERTDNIIALGMGRKGRITRVAAPLLGAPFTYVARTLQRKTAEGQMNRIQLKEILDVLGHG